MTTRADVIFKVRLSKRQSLSPTVLFRIMTHSNNHARQTEMKEHGKNTIQCNSSESRFLSSQLAEGDIRGGEGANQGVKGGGAKSLREEGKEKRDCYGGGESVEKVKKKKQFTNIILR